MYKPDMIGETDRLAAPALIPPKPSLTLAVIGHVNHGKTALVRALTGMETDRLREEVERGLSITLGFAWLELANSCVDIIDAPGHEDYIRAMVGGTTGARAVVLVVSATEGFGRQTLEHLQIAAALGLDAGLVVVTKADLLAPGREAETLASVRSQLCGTLLEGQPIVLCSALTGFGMEAVRQGLDALALRSPKPLALAGAFLPIDRVFSLSGSGTVITGTLQGASLNNGQEAVLWPSGRRATVRQIQNHGQIVQDIEPGGRVAVNLRGLSAAEIKPGEVLCASGRSGDFQSSLQIDIEVTLAANAPGPLKHMDQIRVLWGARQDMATVRLIDENPIFPGTRALVQLRFQSPIIAFAGQRAVLRRPSPAQTLAGMVVLDPQATPHRGRSPQHLALLSGVAAQDFSQIVEQLTLRGNGVVSLTQLARLSRRSLATIQAILPRDFERLDLDRVVSAAAAVFARAAYIERLAEAHRLGPARSMVGLASVRNQFAKMGLNDLLLHTERTLAAAGEIRLLGNQVALADHDPFAALSTDATGRLNQIEARLLAGGLMPQDAACLAGQDPEGQELIGLLIESGRAVSLRNDALRQTLVFHRDALSAAAERLGRLFPDARTFTTGEARAALETKRKFIVPVLEYLDALGLTRREGDVRQVIATKGDAIDRRPTS